MAKKQIATFLGPQLSISYMGGNTWGGWSGLLKPINGTDVVAFNFGSPNKALIAEMGWFVNFDGISGGKFLQFTVSLNGTTVIDQKGEMVGTADWPGTFPFVVPSLIIPPKSKVIVTVATDEAVTVNQYVTFVGKEI